MKVAFVKLSDQRHTVRVERNDGTNESVELDSRSFLRHDLAHFAVELELELTAGVWGSVAGGGSLSGSGLNGADMELAETISGPMQTMMRTGASADEIRDVLARVAPEVDSPGLAWRLHSCLRSLAGQWAATPYRGEMTLEWPEPLNTSRLHVAGVDDSAYLRSRPTSPHNADR
jgi:hypothetical protein